MGWRQAGRQSISTGEQQTGYIMQCRSVLAATFGCRNVWPQRLAATEHAQRQNGASPAASASGLLPALPSDRLLPLDSWMLGRVTAAMGTAAGLPPPYANWSCTVPPSTPAGASSWNRSKRLLQQANGKDHSRHDDCTPEGHQIPIAEQERHEGGEH